MTTIAAPVSASLAGVYDSANIDALVNVMSKASCETALKTGLPNARNLLQRRCVDIVRGYRSVSQGGGGSKNKTECDSSCPTKPTNTTPHELRGVWRGYAIQNGFTVGEWTASVNETFVTIWDAAKKIFAQGSTQSWQPKGAIAKARLPSSCELRAASYELRCNLRVPTVRVLSPASPQLE